MFSGLFSYSGISCSAHFFGINHRSAYGLYNVQESVMKMLPTRYQTGGVKHVILLPRHPQKQNVTTRMVFVFLV